MRGKPAAAAPSFGERFRLPGAAAISSVFSCFSTAKSSKQPFHPVTRAAACGPRAASGDHAGLQANRPRRFSHPVLRLLLRPRDTAGGISPRLKHETKRPKKPPDASRTRACGCRFALVTQPEAFLYGLNMRPNAPKTSRRFPHPGLRLLLRPCDTAGGISPRLKQETKRPKKPPDASRTRACGCRFALVTQSEVFRQP